MKYLLTTIIIITSFTALAQTEIDDTNIENNYQESLTFPKGQDLNLDKSPPFETWYDPIYFGWNGDCVSGKPFWKYGEVTGRIHIGSNCETKLKMGLGLKSPTAMLHVNGDGIFENDLTIESPGVFTAKNKSTLIGKVSIGQSLPNNGNNSLLIRHGGSDGGIEIFHSGQGSSNGSSAITLSTALPQYIAIKIPGKFTLWGDGKMQSKDIVIDAENSSSTGLIIASSGQDTGILSITKEAPGTNTINDVFRVSGDGEVYATAVRVRLEGNFFPDYVFEEDYDLMSLHDLQEFINTNNHLPNIPSAKEVEQEGLDLGEMDRLLTEKVEELTLYILELNKTMEWQKQELEKLKKENNEIKELIKK